MCDGHDEATLVSLYALYAASPFDREALAELHDFTYGLAAHPEWYDGPCLCLQCCSYVES
jgi:hypothetical protein